MQENNIVDTNNYLSNKIIFIILLGVSFFVPIFFVPAKFISPQFGTSLLFSFGIIFSVLVYVFSSLKNGFIDLPNPAKYVLGSMFVVPLVYTLAGIFNNFSRISFFGYTFDISTIGFIILGFTYLFLVSIFFRERSRIFYSYLVFVFSSTILALFVISRIIFGENFLSFGIFNELTSTMIGNWNNIAILFGAGSILSIMTFEMVNVSKIIKIMLGIAIMVSLFFIILVNFFIVWVTLAVCCFVLIFYSIFTPNSEGVVQSAIPKRIKKISPLLFSFFIVTLVFSIFGGVFVNKEKTITIGSYLSKTLNISNLEVRPSFTVTMEIAKNTIKSNPIFGTGPNTFVNQWLIWKPNEIVSTIFWNTDFVNGVGLIPTFAVTTGILGMFSWLIFFGYYIYLGIKSIFLKNEDTFIKYLVTSSFFISLYLWVMTFLYIPSSVVFILTLFFTGLFFSSVYLSGYITIERKILLKSPIVGFVSSLVLVSVFVASVFLGYGLFKNSKSLWYYQKSSHALNTINDPDLSEEYMIKAINLVPYDIYYRSLSEINLVKMGRIISQDPKIVKREDVQKQFSEVLSNAIKSSILAKDTDPSNYLNWISLGKIYESVSAPELKIEGAFESAELAYIEALEINPKNPGILVMLSRLSFTYGDLKKARDYALKAIILKKNYLEAYFILSQIEVSDNNINGAIQSVTAASIIDPTNPATFFQLGLLKYNARDFVGAIVAFERALSIVPDYANAKYFLGLSYELTNQRAKSIKQFSDLRITNPDNEEVKTILSNLESGKSLFTNTDNSKPEKSKSLPIKENRE